MNEGVLSGVLGLQGWPAVAEEAIIARDVLLAEHVGSRLHVCHVSTAGSVEILRWAKARGVDVTAEVTPHHLLLTDELVAGYDPVVQGQPAAADQGRRRGAARGPGRRHDRRRRHRPRPARRSRTRTASGPPPRSGMLGLETALSVVVEAMVRDRPARLGRRRRPDVACGRPGSVGSAATVGRSPSASRRTWSLVDPAARWTVEPAALASKSRNTPYAGASCRAGWSRRSCAGGPHACLERGRCA